VKIALLPSNQVTNATAIRGKSESDLQHAIAVEATADLVSRGIDAKMFWEAEGELSNKYPKYPALYRMCRDATRWGADVVILNHSDACGDQPAGLLSLADYAIRDRSGYVMWTKAFHKTLAAAMGRPEKLWTYDQSYMHFRYGFYSYLADCGFNGFPLIVELANHECYADAVWLRDNASMIGKAIATSLVQTLKLEDDDMTPEDRALLTEIKKSTVATSYRESIALAVACGDWDEADNLYAEAKKAGFEIKGYKRPFPS
jgi:N-acetylmuramoyl-L-alanine amidase